MKKAKETIAWECPNCGKRYSWKWDRGEASEGQISMYCEGRNGCWFEHKTQMVRIGRDVWSAVYREGGRS